MIYNFIKVIFSFIFVKLFIINLLKVFPSIVLLAPLYLISIYFTEIERKKSLANSTVKIYGRDVVASYKILCILVIYPFYSILFSTLNYIAYLE